MYFVLVVVLLPHTSNELSHVILNITVTVTVTGAVYGVLLLFSAVVIAIFLSFISLCKSYCMLLLLVGALMK